MLGYGLTRGPKFGLARNDPGDLILRKRRAE
jgi:hypothetical protein